MQAERGREIGVGHGEREEREKENKSGREATLIPRHDAMEDSVLVATRLVHARI